MKKKIIIPIVIVVLIAALGIVGYLVYTDRKVTTEISIEINPSITLKTKHK